jgi:hypothetical protein
VKKSLIILSIVCFFGAIYYLSIASPVLKSQDLSKIESKKSQSYLVDKHSDVKQSPANLEHKVLRQSLIGLKISAEDKERFDVWAKALSRNSYEHQLRLDDLKFAKRAEVINFPALKSEKLIVSDDTYNPTIIDLPGFSGGKLSIAVTEIEMSDTANGTLYGTITGEESSSAVLSFHNGQVAGMLQGQNNVYFYDGFEGETVILRELDANDYTASMREHEDAVAINEAGE